MTIMLKKNGQLIIDPAPPLEGKDANLDNLAAFISDPQDGNAIVYNAEKGIWEAREVSGGGGGGMVIHMDDATGALDKTWQEIFDALANGTVCTIPMVSSLSGELSFYRVCSALERPIDPKFTVSAVIEIVNFSSGEVTTEGMVFASASADDYPVATGE